MTAPIHVVGIGLAGASSLPARRQSLVRSATLLVGGSRHLAAFECWIATDGIEALPLGDFTQTFEQVRSHLTTHLEPRVVILASGDPLFFGIGRLLLTAFPAEQLVFYPHVSAIQLAFSRLRLPWQTATLLSVHGRDETLLVKALKRGDELIATLTDGVLTPSVIAALIVALDSPSIYRLWVCENLGSDQEQISLHDPKVLADRSVAFAALNVVVLQRQLDNPCEDDLLKDSPSAQTQLRSLPLIGLPDSVFNSFYDRPALITKREIRLQILGELAPLDGQIIWDIGAGTGAVSVEISRLCPNATIYAVEKTAAGAVLIAKNADRLAIAPIYAVQGEAPDALRSLPSPNRVFIGGSSGALIPILNRLSKQATSARIVIALATLENLTAVLSWLKEATPAALWRYRLIQVSIARSLPVGPLTRLSPLTPITLITLIPKTLPEEITL